MFYEIVNEKMMHLTGQRPDKNAA